MLLCFSFQMYSEGNLRFNQSIGAIVFFIYCTQVSANVVYAVLKHFMALGNIIWIPWMPTRRFRSCLASTIWHRNTIKSILNDWGKARYNKVSEFASISAPIYFCQPYGSNGMFITVVFQTSMRRQYLYSTPQPQDEVVFGLEIRFRTILLVFCHLQRKQKLQRFLQIIR